MPVPWRQKKCVLTSRLNGYAHSIIVAHRSVIAGYVFDDHLLIRFLIERSQRATVRLDFFARIAGIEATMALVRLVKV